MYIRNAQGHLMWIPPQNIPPAPITLQTIQQNVRYQIQRDEWMRFNAPPQEDNLHFQDQYSNYQGSLSNGYHNVSVTKVANRRNMTHLGQQPYNRMDPPIPSVIHSTPVFTDSRYNSGANGTIIPPTSLEASDSIDHRSHNKTKLIEDEFIPETNSCMRTIFGSSIDLYRSKDRSENTDYFCFNLEGKFTSMTMDVNEHEKDVTNSKDSSQMDTMKNLEGQSGNEEKTEEVLPQELLQEGIVLDLNASSCMNKITSPSTRDAVIKHDSTEERGNTVGRLPCKRDKIQSNIFKQDNVIRPKQPVSLKKVRKQFEEHSAISSDAAHSKCQNDRQENKKYGSVEGTISSVKENRKVGKSNDKAMMVANNFVIEGYQNSEKSKVEDYPSFDEPEKPGTKREIDSDKSTNTSQLIGSPSDGENMQRNANLSTHKDKIVF